MRRTYLRDSIALVLSLSSRKMERPDRPPRDHSSANPGKRRKDVETMTQSANLQAATTMAPTARQQILPLDADATDEIDPVEIAMIERCKAGEMAAWDTLIKRYEPSVFKFAYSLCHCHEDADDITGRVFLRLYRNIHNFRHECSFRSWLFRIVRNNYIDTCIRAAHRRNVSLYSAVDSDGETVYPRDAIDPQPGPERTCLDNETALLLNQAILHLPAYQREVVRMYHIEGKSYGAIASTTGLSIGTIKSRLNRARINLRERLAPMRETLIGE
jgi:RNA polymerase sigma-70 factor (ECF subfamily)